MFKLTRFAIFLVALSFTSNVVAQDSIISKYETLVSPSIISSHLKIIASDSLEGRETGTNGMILASDYVSNQYKESGISSLIPNNYYQDISFAVRSGSDLGIEVNGITFEPGNDFYTTELFSQKNILATEMVFVGYGIVDPAAGWDDYKSTDAFGKVVLILDNEPRNKKGEIILQNTDKNWSENKELKIEIAKKNNAAAILFINRTFDFNGDNVSRWKTRTKYSLLDSTNTVKAQTIYISAEMADRILVEYGYSIEKYETKVRKTKKEIRIQPQTNITIKSNPEQKSCRNVIGFIEGTDLKNEYIILSAHLDHLGKRDDKIYNGADDDGSGSASLMTIAQAFAEAAKEGNGPRRSLIFLSFTGEEKGLLGSEFYVNNPVVPLSNTVADLNIDMIGRVDTIARSTKYYSYIIGSDKLSHELHEINESSNKSCCNLELDYRYNDPSDKLRLYSRSDHYNFAKQNIPVIFYFTGLHEDYHKPTDTFEKIDFDKTARVAKLVFYTAWELANRNERIRLDEPMK